MHDRRRGTARERGDRPRVLPLLVAALALAFLIGGFAVVVGPGTAGHAILVTSTADSGPGTLRQAVAAADAGSTITFDPVIDGQPILLATAIPIGTGLILLGNGAGNTLIDGGATTRLFEVAAGSVVFVAGLTLQDATADLDGGAISNAGELTLEEVVMTGNVAEFGGGGAIHNTGTLTLTGSTLSGNGVTGFLGTGGGIHNVGTLTIVGSTLDGNTAAEGGAIMNAGGATAMVAESMFTGNMAASSGGGIYNTNPSVITITNSTLTGNTALTGAGVFNDGVLTVFGSTLAANTADVQGGGIANGESGNLTVSGSTLSENGAASGAGLHNAGTAAVTDSALEGNNAADAGGGIWNTGDLHVIASTLAGNAAHTGHGGAIWNDGTAVLASSTLDQNAASFGGGGIFNAAGTLGLTGSTVTRNSADATASGGGIHNAGALAIADSTLALNSAGEGGGIHNRNQGSVNATQTVFDANVAFSRGGAMYNLNHANLADSVLTGNTALDGGGLFNGGTLTLAESTLSGNHAENEGGAAYLADGRAVLSSSSVTGNTAATGAGIHHEAGGLALLASPVFANTATVASQNRHGAHPETIVPVMNATTRTLLVADVDGMPETSYRIDAYTSADCALPVAGDRGTEVFLGTSVVTTDLAGEARFDLPLAPPSNAAFGVLATATLLDGAAPLNTGAPSACLLAPAAAGGGGGGGGGGPSSPTGFLLSQQTVFIQPPGGTLQWEFPFPLHALHLDADATVRLGVQFTDPATLHVLPPGFEPTVYGLDLEMESEAPFAGTLDIRIPADLASDWPRDRLVLLHRSGDAWHEIPVIVLRDDADGLVLRFTIPHAFSPFVLAVGPEPPQAAPAPEPSQPRLMEPLPRGDEPLGALDDPGEVEGAPISGPALLVAVVAAVWLLRRRL